MQYHKHDLFRKEKMCNFFVNKLMQKQYLVSTMINVEDENDEDDLQFLSARLPGNSFPATSPLMVATSMAGSADDNDNSDENDDQVVEDKELLKRLRQGQERMEQVILLFYNPNN